MIAVIFEVWPAEGKTDAYLDIAGGLRPMLEGADGFISIERFESLVEPGKYLSLSFWRDEEAVAAWRRTREHRDAQAAGRGGVFTVARRRGTARLRHDGTPRRGTRRFPRGA